MYLLQENNRFLHRSPFFLEELPSYLRTFYLSMSWIHFLEEITIFLRTLQTNVDIVLNFETSSTKIPSSLRRYKVRGDGMVSEETRGIEQCPQGKTRSSQRDDKDVG